MIRSVFIALVYVRDWRANGFHAFELLDAMHCEACLIDIVLQGRLRIQEIDKRELRTAKSFSPLLF